MIIVNLDVMMARRKMSLNELSERVGITIANLSKLKTGKAKAIRFSTLDAICKALDCTPSDILEYRDELKRATMIAMFLLIHTICFGQITIKGHVVNEQGDGVEYVSIGIDEDSVGVISDAQGHFTLSIPAGRKDELTFTHVSYQTATVPYTTYAEGGELTVTLRDKIVELAEVVVGKKNKSHTLSGKSWLRYGQAGFTGNQTGDIEWGPIFKNRKDFVLSDILLTISKCKYEECVLSFNVYELRGKQFVNILNKPIYQRITPDDDGRQFSVSPSESVVLKGKQEYCVTVSMVDVKGKGELSFPANFKSSYVRNAVKGKMRKLPACPLIIVKGYEI